MTFVRKGFVNNVNFLAAVKQQRKDVAEFNRQTEFLPDDHPSRVKKGEKIPLAKPNTSLKPGEYKDITEDFRNILLKLPLKHKYLEQRHRHPFVEQIHQGPK